MRMNLLVAICLAVAWSAGTIQTSGRGALRPAPSGQVFVGDTHHDRIVQLHDLTGTGWTAFGSEGRGVNQFRLPRGVFVDRDGRIYVADAGNRRIVRVDDMTGTGWTTYGTSLPRTVLPTSAEGRAPGKFAWPKAVFVDAQKRIYVTDWIADRIVRMNDMRGTAWLTFGTRGGGTGQFRAPDGIFVDAAGHVYVADSSNDRIVRVNDMSGRGWTTFGISGIGKNQFRLPSGIFVDALGRIYVADRGNRRVVRIDDMTGIGWTSLRGRGPDKFAVPSAIAVGGRGEIYVLDIHAGLIGMRNILGTGWTVFGKGTSPRDFESPEGLAIH
jgi:DNA-binding beta-propeller fold protein YncE